MTDGVTVSLPALKRAWQTGGKESVWVRVQTKTPLEVAAAAAEAAMLAANDTEEKAATDGEPRIGATGVSLTPQGPVIFIDFCDDARALQTWLAQVAAELTAGGMTGKLAPIRTDHAPIDNDNPLTVTAALTVPIDWSALDHDIATLHGVDRGWYADPDLTTDLVARLVRWCLFPGEVYLRHQVPQFRVTPEQAEPLASAALRAGPPVTLTCARADGDFQRVRFDLHGQVTLARRRSGQTWEQDVSSFEDILTTVAPLLEQGLIRRSFLQTSWEATVTNRLQTAPLTSQGIVRGGRMTRLRKVFARRTIDAYGVQILTDQHLANAHDLSQWDIHALGAGRHLVRARDLNPWFVADSPDPQTLTQARTDFGDLILNATVVHAEPDIPLL